MIKRWDRLAATLNKAGHEVKVDRTVQHGETVCNVTFRTAGGLVAIGDRWWRDHWVGWQVTAEGPDSIVARWFPRTKKISEVASHFQEARALLAAKSHSTEQMTGLMDINARGARDNALRDLDSMIRTLEDFKANLEDDSKTLSVREVSERFTVPTALLNNTLTRAAMYSEVGAVLEDNTRHRLDDARRRQPAPTGPAPTTTTQKPPA